MSSTRGSRKPQQIRAAEGCGPTLKALREDGAVVIRGLVSTSEARSINEEIDQAMQKHITGTKHSDQFFKDFHGANTKRLMNLVTLSKTFREAILENDLMHKLCEEVFTKDSGTYWMNSAQCIDIGPGSKAQPLHRDQWQFPIFTLVGPDAPEASINFIVALTEFTEENGATRVILGSHKWNDFNDNGKAEDTVPVELKPGDAVFISGKVVHGGGANSTEDIRRRGVSLVFQCSYLTPEEAYPFLVDKKLAKTLSPRAQRTIGFRSQFPKNCPGVWKCDYSDIGDTLHCSEE
ncbi:hypothetical protein XA68_12324 [Ophiocordyceps unilateralis]|uniref:Fe2OG dioxygenase domain-containing protein n=1 Tax=Ophiocordyceps unilateralis TaxID=268505 RepID=A0A2A9PUG1_OPHUN|nr:hypothetical protein XA68_12324 [Ophiocordyceps unilateralis]